MKVIRNRTEKCTVSMHNCTCACQFLRKESKLLKVSRIISQFDSIRLHDFSFIKKAKFSLIIYYKMPFHVLFCS